jgi:hypothetical protein
MPQKKHTKKIKVRDLKPRNDAKGGPRIVQGGPSRLATSRNYRYPPPAP